MNKTLKYFGILAILPLLTVALTIDYSTEAEGTKAVGPKAAKSLILFCHLETYQNLLGKERYLPLLSQKRD